MSCTNGRTGNLDSGLDADALGALEAAVPGGLRLRAIDRLGHAHDASHYLLIPDVVIAPRTLEQAASLMRACSSTGLPLTFRSGGTSLSGQAGTKDVLVDTRRHFREITVLDGGARVRVEPGATVRQVNARLAAFGTKLGPDPASETACTLGGVIANNSSGMACGTELNTYRTLESAVLVLASGTVINTADLDADVQLAHLEPEMHAGLRRLRARVRDNTESVRILTEQFQLKNTMGYGLNAFLDFERPVDVLLHLVIGSEGTLAFVAQATFRTVPVRASAATGLLVFANLGLAIQALPSLVESGFATVELLDATSLHVSQRDPRADASLTGLAIVDHAALLVEYQEASPAELEVRISGSGSLLDGLPLVAPSTLSVEPNRRASLWHLRKGLYASVAGNRPAGTTAILEDIAVLIPELAKVCAQLVSMFDRHGYEDSVIFGHAKDGNLHFLLNERFDQPAFLRRYADFTEELVELVLGSHGTLKAEHGTGRIMAPFVRRQYGDQLYSVMVELKGLIDPSLVLNPGVIINDNPRAHVSNLKTAPQVEEEVDRCVECGFCEPVCPSKDLTLTPRQRIVLRREIAKARRAGDDALAEELDQDYGYDGIETCATDGMCQTSCPVLIDTGSLVKRLRAEQHSSSLDRVWNSAARHWGVATRVGAAALTLANRLPDGAVTTPNGLARQALGTDNVPAWGPDLPQGGPSRRAGRWSQGSPDAVFFAACVGSIFGPTSGPGAAAAFTTLCDRVGINLVVPGGIRDLCCGTPWKSKGMSAGHATMSAKVLEALWTASLQGALPVVCDASSCTEGLLDLTGAFPALDIVDSVTFVRDRVLPHLDVSQQLDSVTVHPTCSSARLGVDDALVEIARVTARDAYVPMDWGCCAFAGDRGLLHPELTASATEREAQEVSRRDSSAHVSCNRTCEVGMTRATGKQYRHVIELLEELTRPAASKPGP